MAVGNTSPTKGQLHELQQTFEHKQRRVEPEPEFQQCCDQQTLFPAARQLAKSLNSVALDFGYGQPLHLEVPPVQAEGCISGYGKLPNNG